MYDKVSTNLEFVEREKEIQKFWKDHDIFEKSIKAREGCPVFTFYDGPPTANGKPHIGHIITRAVKDLIPRYKTMKGSVRRAGIPTAFLWSWKWKKCSVSAASLRLRSTVLSRLLKNVRRAYGSMNPNGVI